MKWPWQRPVSTDRLVVAYAPDSLAYLQAQGERVLRAGLELRGNDTPQAFAKRVRALGLASTDVIAVLPMSQYQLLQIEAPAVPDDELKSAARWQIKGMLDASLEDITLDVMPLGDGNRRGARQVFVVAAQNRAVQDVSLWAKDAGLALKVIDIHETLQRNVQSALAESRGLQGRASAALFVHGTQCLLTIVARGELFYSRRLDWQPAMLSGGSAACSTALPEFDTDADMVDYADEPSPERPNSPHQPSRADASPLVIELQRSFDLWERSHPEQPLDSLLVHAFAESQVLATQLESMLPVTVDVFNADALFPGLAAVTTNAAVRRAVLPLLGALHRVENRSS